MHQLRNYLLAALIPVLLNAQPPGQTIVLRDGRQITGTIVNSDGRDITFRERDGDLRHFNFDQVQSINFNGEPASPAYQDRNREQAYNRGHMSVPAGAEIAIRTNEGIDSRDASEARSYAAQVDRDVVDINGNIVIPRGSDARLVVRNIGGNQVALDLQSVNVNGRRYTIDTDEAEVVGGGRRPGENRRTGEFVGGGAALGALIGAIAGGGKGAGIGALAGGAAGAAAEVLTKGDRVRVPAESVLNFRLESPVFLHPIG